MNNFQLPDLNKARYRTKDYKAQIIRNAIDLTENQMQLGKGLFYNVRTYGCQANVRDGEVLCGIFEKMGFEFTEELAKADVIILNTCAIRENAEKKVIGEIGYLQAFKRLKPSLVVGMCGCMAQEEGIVNILKEKYPIVNLIFGTHNINQLPLLLEDIMLNNNRRIDVYSIQGNIYEDLPSIRNSKYKASVTIMDGCDKFCTYCIVPYTRGQQRSRLSADILAEVKCLKEQGYKEVMLLGQNVNAYGKDLDNDLEFSQLLEEVAKIGISRIRFMTSHPWDFTDKMLDVIAKYHNIMPYIHLPLQSGNTEILKKMSRRYTKEEYIALVDRIKNKIPNVVLSTDIIVGFPNETEEQFQDTLDVVEYCKYDNAFSFIYSPREGTPGAKMEDHVDTATKKDRLARLNERLDYYSKQNNLKYEGKILNVLVDGVSKTNENVMSGYSEENKLVNFKASNAKIGDIIKVRIIKAKKNSLDGEQED